jgi:hypothetical protein
MPRRLSASRLRATISTDIRGLCTSDIGRLLQISDSVIDIIFLSFFSFYVI